MKRGGHRSGEEVRGEEAHRIVRERGREGWERRSRDDVGILDGREPVVVTVLCESGRAQTDRGVSRRSAYVELGAPRWGVSCHRASVSCSRSGDDHRLLRNLALGSGPCRTGLQRDGPACSPVLNSPSRCVSADTATTMRPRRWYSW